MIGNVVKGQDGPGPSEKGGNTVEVPEVGRDQSRLPIVAVQDIRCVGKGLTHREDRLREVGEAEGIVRVVPLTCPVQMAPVVQVVPLHEVAGDFVLHMGCQNLRRKDLSAEVERIKVIYNGAWSDNWGALPMSDREFDHLAKQLKAVLEPELVLIAEVEGKPVAFAMAFAGLAGFAYLSDVESALTLLAQDIFETLSAYPLSVIPMFILMGSFAFASGISQRLYVTSYTWFGQWPGGLTVATVLACSGFAAICGSTAATAATMGKIRGGPGQAGNRRH